MCSAPALRRMPNASSRPKRWLRSTAPTTLPRSRHSTNAERSGASSGRLTTRSTRPPGALVPACRPLSALQDVDARLVLERDRGLGVDRQAVAAEVEAVVDDEAANGEVVDVALGVVRRGHGRIEARQVREAARAGVADLLDIDRRRLQWRARERHVGPAGDARRHRRLAGDRHRRERCVLREGRRQRRREKGAPARRAAARRGARRESFGPSSFRWQSSGPESPAAAGSACFPARGLPQSGSKGLSQSKRADCIVDVQHP